jgi:predicted glycogen debranching enzyme
VSVRFAPVTVRETDLLLSREWLVGNGLGGYASGSVPGACTRRFHGLLVAALPAPLGRIVLLTRLQEEVRFADGTGIRLDADEPGEGQAQLHGAQGLISFRLEMGLPVWRYAFDGEVLERRVHLPYQQNTVHVTYRRLEGKRPLRLRLRPGLRFRPHEGAVSEPQRPLYGIHIEPGGIKVYGDRSMPPLRMTVPGTESAFVHHGGTWEPLFYRLEKARGYDANTELWSPGYFRIGLPVGGSATFIASTESWDTVHALTAEQAWPLEVERRRRLLEIAPHPCREGPAAELTLAADSFIVSPRTRAADEAVVHAAGDESRTVVAGYHWFTDWGRDTMISLEGLTLRTGRGGEGGAILRTFARSVRDGLVPNYFPEGDREGVYHTADATLWFFHALDRYLAASGDHATLQLLLPTLAGIVEHHLRGTRFGIGVDPEDGLLRQGTEDYPLTWMDAKVGDWVVTPRRGKAVEINALWYHALCLLARWSSDETYLRHAERCRESFNRRFWNERGRYLHDVVDGPLGDDPSFRPNQIFAISLGHPVLDPARWALVVDQVEQRLVTPVGLRSLAPGEADYQPRYDGDLRARDAAYHQGTVWAWLIGPFLDAWRRVHPGDPRAGRRFLEGFVPHLGQACVGSVSEIFDAEPPFTPRGCISQAWSVAEVLRAWLDTEG